GVPRKNIRPLGGRPAIVWTIEASLASRAVERTVVSTEDAEIAEVARRAGAEVPFMRPRELAGDDAGDLPVYEHAVSRLAAEGYEPDVVVWLRPTAPLREAEDIDAALVVLERTGADCVRSITPVEHHPFWMYRLEGDRALPWVDVDERDYPRRQDL